MNKILLFFIVTAFLCPLTAFAQQRFQIKNVAVVETQIDEASGVADDVNKADLREITSVLRREAVKNLPRNRFNVMTSETVLAMGDAVLIDCAEENCVIALGTKIGADYIVRGTLSKVRGVLSLTVELFETEYGNLRAITPEPIRTTDLVELLNKSAPACEAMYKKFVEENEPTMITPYTPGEDLTPEQFKKSQAKKTREPKPKKEPKPKEPLTLKYPEKMSYGGGALFAADFTGGVDYGNKKTQVTMPFYGGGAYAFFDAMYATATVNFIFGGGDWDRSDSKDPEHNPSMSRTIISIGAYAKSPSLYRGSMPISLFATAGLEYEINLSAKLDFDGYEYKFDGKSEDLGELLGTYKRPKASDLNTLWGKAGAGADYKINEKLYLRPEILYCIRIANDFEETLADNVGHGRGWPIRGHGLTIKVGVGMKL